MFHIFAFSPESPSNNPISLCPVTTGPFNLPPRNQKTSTHAFNRAGNVSTQTSSPSIEISQVIIVCGRYGGGEKYFLTGRAVNMAGMVDLELVYLIRNFLYQRGDQGATVNDLLREVDMNFSTVYDALIYMQEEGEVHYKQQMGYMIWYVKDVA
jgi:hypothetical protein